MPIPSCQMILIRLPLAPLKTYKSPAWGSRPSASCTCSDTDDPGASDAATISRFRSSGQDRCRRRSLKLVSITELVDTSYHHAPSESPTFSHSHEPEKAALGGGIPSP